ncbi:hypothetical protein K438DRAFT_1976695 [Mycena galopus ATCC 62051]|nr:hypothetical protein K438DRAFT_1976695 [Mycena galopus ATCC 62051]
MNGVRPVPIWSVRDDVKWCSVGAAPFDIPPDANTYTLQSEHEDFEDVLRNEKSESYAAYFLPDQHWLGWAPVQSGNRRSDQADPFDDPAWFVFDLSDVDLDEHRIDDLYLGNSEPDLADVRGTLIGYYLSRAWRKTVIHLSSRVRNISEILASSTEWYGKSSMYRVMGPMPGAVTEEALERLVSSAEEASIITRGARYSVASQLGWLCWFTSSNGCWESSLVKADLDFVRSLSLQGRAKRGFLYNLSRDYHELNFSLLMICNVPFHFAWTPSEDATGRFIRCSPQFLSEYEGLASRGGRVELAGLPSFGLWKEDLGRYDRFFQDSRAGRVGHLLREFADYWEYKIVDFSHYGARPVDSRVERRVCAERFKGIVTASRERDGTSLTTCTFFRQNPIRVDEPPSTRRQPNPHPFSLDVFGRQRPDDGDEHHLFFQDAMEIRESWKTRCAPRPDRAFSTYNGSEIGRSLAIVPAPSGVRTTESSAGRGSSLAQPGREGAPKKWENPMSPTRRSEQSVDLGLTSKWVQDVAASQTYAPVRRRASRSLSPHEDNARRGRRESSMDARSQLRSRSHSSLSTHSSKTSSIQSFADEYHSAKGDVDERMGNLDSFHQAVQRLQEWAPSVLELELPMPILSEWKWNQAWIHCSILVCKSPRSTLRLKTIAACLNQDDVVDVLGAGIRSGIPFHICVLQSHVRKIGMDTDLSESRSRSLTAMYAPGFVETHLDYGSGGADLYARYLTQVGSLLLRPHAVGFIALGGFISYVAQVLDGDLVHRFREGPSLQLTRFSGGEVTIVDKEGNECLYVSDRVSDGEIRALCGQISRGSHLKDSFLWPLPAWIEEESWHYSGAWTAGFFRWMVALKTAIMDRGHFHWRTEREWRRFIRTGNRGSFRTGPIPTETFDEGQRLMDEAFPMDWHLMDLTKIEVPEIFTPLSARD